LTGQRYGDALSAARVGSRASRSSRKAAPRRNGDFFRSIRARLSDVAPADCGYLQIDRPTGEIREAWVFVAVRGASNFT
jgi:hypothetical protein